MAVDLSVQALVEQLEDAEQLIRASSNPEFWFETRREAFLAEVAETKQAAAMQIGKVRITLTAEISPMDPEDPMDIPTAEDLEDLIDADRVAIGTGANEAGWVVDFYTVKVEA